MSQVHDIPWEHERWPDEDTRRDFTPEMIELDNLPDAYFVQNKLHRPYVARGPMLPEDFYRVGRLLIEARYQFARSMPQNPHWYTLRKYWAHLGPDYHRIFTAVNRAIREHGYTEYFASVPWRMLNVNGNKYWNYHSSRVEEVIVLNRRPIFGVKDPFDDLADAYDEVLSDQSSLDENRDVMDLLGNLHGMNVLDIGCGTGLLLDYKQDELAPELYTGMDPSEGMLERLFDKHPVYTPSTMVAKFEEFVPMTGPYDLVVSLFGSPAYIDPLYLEQIPNMVAPGGRWVVMFLKEGYEPVTYRRTGHEGPVPVTGVHADLPGERHEIGEFIVVDGRKA